MSASKQNLNLNNRRIKDNGYRNSLASTTRCANAVMFAVLVLLANKPSFSHGFSPNFSIATTYRADTKRIARTSRADNSHCASLVPSGTDANRFSTKASNDGATNRNGIQALHASSTSENEDPRKTNEEDTGQKILGLAVPALGALLIDPLLTLADTAFVGRFAESPYELAGMGSASALLTFAFYVFNFLCTATTPLVASRRASKDEAGALAVGGQALSLAFGLGSVLAVSLILLQGPLLNLMGAGEDNAFASSFLTIRSLAAPAVFCISASTGILRGYLDTKTPIFVLFLANAVNFGLDVLLIAVGGLGPTGAAIATTTAEWISALLFLLVLAGKIPSADGELGRKEPTEAAEQATTLVVAPSLSIPPWEEVKPLIVASSAVFVRSLVLQLFLTTAAALTTRTGDTTSGGSAGGAAFISAHQIAIQLWMLCSYISDALAAASQGLVADALGRGDAPAARDISRTVFAYSSVLGFLLAGALYVGFYSTDVLVDGFTSDRGTQAALLEIASLLVVSQPLNSLVFAADGVLQGASEFPYQAKSMVVSGVAGSACFLALQSTGQSDNLFNVWSALVCLQAMRGITSAVKIVDDEGPIRLNASE
ncbi:unnamed protein product [Pseudo-nitzschia multistriata]|uniref:Polysaccharide biosynthesis protein C-terminal domain-containing protein n=1 Tax=Pseudo-nitzschia multistriata TaxID=183589 RepID=A0A448ZF80_9STRA|nr:unnamed protein product [Pseudo-nitzschia multistriata]